MADDIEADKNDSSTAGIVKKRPLNLYDLPELILERMKGELPLVDCLVLRKVSKGLRSFVDSSKAHCQTLKILFGPDYAGMTLDNLELNYRKAGNRGCLVLSNRKDTEETKIYRVDRNFKCALIADVSTFLKMPKLEIGDIEFEFRVNGSDTWLELLKLLKSLNHRLNVKTIRSKDFEFLHSVQQYLNPDMLEEILYAPDSVYLFEKIAETTLDVLKNPKLKFEKLVFDCYRDEKSAKFSEILKTLDSQLNIKLIHIEDGRWIPSILQSLNPEKVDHISIYASAKLTVDQFHKISGLEWKKRISLMGCPIPEGIGFEELVGFNEIRSHDFELSEDNLIIIRDILLKSPHLQKLELRQGIGGTLADIWNMSNMMIETVVQIMSQSPAYNVSSGRFSISNSLDYFQLKLYNYVRAVELSIQRVSAS